MYNNAFNNLTSLYNNPVTAGFYGQQNKQEIIKVNGREGANAFQLMPNSSVLMLDINQPIVYLKQSDGGGYCSVTAYKIEPYQAEAAEASDLERRIKRLEDIINESNTFSIKSAESEKSAQSD